MSCGHIGAQLGCIIRMGELQGYFQRQMLRTVLERLVHLRAHPGAANPNCADCADEAHVAERLPRDGAWRTAMLSLIP